MKQEKKAKGLCACMLTAALVLLCACQAGGPPVVPSVPGGENTLEQTQGAFAPLQAPFGGPALTVALLQDDVQEVAPNIADALRDALVEGQGKTQEEANLLLDAANYQSWKVTLLQQCSVGGEDVPYTVEFEALVWQSERLEERYFAVCKVSDPAAFSNNPALALHSVSAWTEINLLSPVKDEAAIPCVVGVRAYFSGTSAFSAPEKEQDKYTLVSEIALVDTFRDAKE